jgi:ribosomal protein L11 methyltransferase
MHHKDTSVWRLALTAPDDAAAEAAAAALAAACGAVSAFGPSPDGAWRVEGFATAPPAAGLVEATLALAWIGRDGAPPVLDVERLPARDWIAENQASFPPLTAGRYLIHGRHFRPALPGGRIGLCIDAATAFGTGDHATTRGCLLALDDLAKRRRRHRTLDMGTGTGILAIAAAKTWPGRAWARDVDPEAVRVAAENAAGNGVGARVAVRRADGYGDRELRRGGPFDLIFANILARPLVRMAPQLARALVPGGIAVLSGLLARQESAVLAAHRLQGLALIGRIAIDGWHTLVLRRRAALQPIARPCTTDPHE